MSSKAVDAKQGTPAIHEDYSLIRPVNDNWGIFFEMH